MGRQVSRQTSQGLRPDELQFRTQGRMVGDEVTEIGGDQILECHE